MKGLIIKEKYLNMILEGKKTWEIRSSNTKIRGKIALIQSGSSKIMGYCELVDAKPLTKDEMLKNTRKHKVSKKVIEEDRLRYKKPHAWILKNAKPLKRSKPYKHPHGAVIWVNL
jgi:predicted transcriptional regulator